MKLKKTIKIIVIILLVIILFVTGVLLFAYFRWGINIFERRESPTKDLDPAVCAAVTYPDPDEPGFSAVIQYKNRVYRKLPGQYEIISDYEPDYAVPCIVEKHPFTEAYLWAYAQDTDRNFLYYIVEEYDFWDTEWNYSGMYYDISLDLPEVTLETTDRIDIITRDSNDVLDDGTVERIEDAKVIADLLQSDEEKMEEHYTDTVHIQDYYAHFKDFDCLYCWIYSVFPADMRD